MSILLTPSGQRSDDSLWQARANTVYVATTRVLLMRKLYPAFKLKRSSQNSFFSVKEVSHHNTSSGWGASGGDNLAQTLTRVSLTHKNAEALSELLNRPFLSTFTQMCRMTHFPKSPDKTPCQFIIALRERLYNRFQRVFRRHRCHLFPLNDVRRWWWGGYESHKHNCLQFYNSSDLFARYFSSATERTVWPFSVPFQIRIMMSFRKTTGEVNKGKETEAVIIVRDWPGHQQWQKRCNYTHFLWPTQTTRQYGDLSVTCHSSHSLWMFF